MTLYNNCHQRPAISFVGNLCDSSERKWPVAKMDSTACSPNLKLQSWKALLTGTKESKRDGANRCLAVATLMTAYTSSQSYSIYIRTKLLFEHVSLCAMLLQVPSRGSSFLERWPILLLRIWKWSKFLGKNTHCSSKRSNDFFCF